MNSISLLVYIEWCDAMSREEPWTNYEEAIKWADNEDWLVAQVGFIIKETKEYLLIAGNKSSYNKDNPEYGGIMKIPTTWIRKRIDLQEHIK